MFIEPLNNSFVTARLIKAGVVLSAFLFGHLLGQAEYNRVAERLQLSDAERESLDIENRQLSAELSAMVEKSYTNDEAVAGLQQSLAEIRVQRIKDGEELKMFRNLATGGENITGIAIDEVAITGFGENHYQLDLRLIQPRGRKRVSGEVDIKVVGEKADVAASLSLKELLLDARTVSHTGPGEASGETVEFPNFDFRYFQQFQAEIVLPEGFTPEQIEINANPVNPHSPLIKNITMMVPWEASQSSSLLSLSN